MRVLMILVAAGVLTALAVSPAAARPQSTTVGNLRFHDSGQLKYLEFLAEEGHAQNLVVSDDGEYWRIRTLSPDTVIQGGDGCVDRLAPSFYRSEWKCHFGLKVQLLDLDDRFISSAAQAHSLNVDGGTGRDFILTSRLSDALSGGAGNDTIYAGLGDDRVSGGAGDDVLIGNAGADLIDGGDGVDLTSWPGSEPIVVTLGDSLANDGRADESDTVLNVENVLGTPAGDTITGSNVANRIEGRGGDDRLYGLFGSDVLLGLTGDDRLDGGWGDDRLEGGDANDTLLGGFGRDRVFGGAGSDTLEGGPAAHSDQLFGGAGDDKLRGGFGEDILEGGDGSDTIYTNDATGRADSARDVVKCGAGVDTVYLGPEDHADSDCENVIPD